MEHTNFVFKTLSKIYPDKRDTYVRYLVKVLTSLPSAHSSKSSLLVLSKIFKEI